MVYARAISCQQAQSFCGKENIADSNIVQGYLPVLYLGYKCLNHYSSTARGLMNAFHSSNSKISQYEEQVIAGETPDAH